MPLVDDSLADWRNPEWRERDLEGLAEFFNNYEIPFWGFDASDKNKQLYLKQMAEVNEFVSLCLEDLMFDKKEEKYKKEIGVVNDFIENSFITQILNSELLSGWQHWQIVYQLEIFGQEDSQVWTIDFGETDKPKLYKGDLGKINLYEGISSSEMCALIEETTSWDYVTLCGNYRTFNNIYRVTDGGFELPPEDKSNYALEPLMDIFPWDKDMDRRKFMRDVQRWKGNA